ncbi:MAG: histidinol phosphatase [Flavobacterium sp.]|nr:histidinol phosphatase [Flavobacterium sp.]
MFSIFKSKPKLSDLIPEGTIDIHSHLLPGIDDGATDISNTINLLEGIRKIGFTKCIATPHTLPEIWENTSDGIMETFHTTKNNLEEPLQTMLHHAASEYMINEAFLDRLNSEPLLTIKDNIVLIEMSYMNPPLALKEIIFEIQIKGYQPLLAHPERYLFYHQNTKMYTTLKELDVKFQMNLLSSVGYYGSKVAIAADFLLKENYIDFVGTDVHHMKHIVAFENKIIVKSESQLQSAIERNSFYE